MRSFEEIPDIAERIKRSKMELQESGFYLAPEWDSQSCCDQDYVNNFKKGWESRQTEVDDLQKRLDAVKQLIQKYKDEDRELKLIDEWEQSQVYGLVASELEKALKGGNHEAN